MCHAGQLNLILCRAEVGWVFEHGQEPFRGGSLKNADLVVILGHRVLLHSARPGRASEARGLGHSMRKQVEFTDGGWISTEPASNEDAVAAHPKLLHLAAASQVRVPVFRVEHC